MKISEIKYQRPNYKAVVKKFDQLIKLFNNSNSLDEQLAIEKEFFKLSDEITTQGVLANIRFNQNTKDPFYQNEYKFIQKNASKIKIKYVKLSKAYLNSKFLNELKQHIPEHVFLKFTNELKVYKKKVIMLMIKESLTEMKYTKLMSSLTFDFNGKKMTPSTILKYFQSPDRDIRKGAYNAFGKAILDNKEELDRIYSKLVRLRSKRAKKLGFKSFTDVSYLTLNRLDYNKEDIKKFREYVKKYIVPLVSEIKEKVKAEFNIDKFMLYDDEIYTKEEPKPIGTQDEILSNGIKMYQEMSKDTGDLYKMMLDAESFDVESRDGKRGGGFCTSLPLYKLPYIHANFNGSMGDIKVLTHEFGHALAARKSYNYESHHVRRVGMETAEVHSMSMEFLTYNWMELFFGNNVDVYKFSHIAKSIAFIPYGTIVDYFQEIIYDNPNLTSDQRNKVWKDLESEYLEHMSTEGIIGFEEGRRWQRQMHIYSIPFYYIDYCLAQVTAFQFLSLMENNYQEAFDKYMKFVNQAGTKPFTQLLKSVGLKSPFEEQTFKDIVEVVKKNLKL